MIKMLPSLLALLSYVGKITMKHKSGIEVGFWVWIYFHFTVSKTFQTEARTEGDTDPAEVVKVQWLASVWYLWTRACYLTFILNLDKYPTKTVLLPLRIVETGYDWKAIT